MLILAAIEKFHTKSIDFVLAYSQADLDVDIYIVLPQLFNVGHESRRYVLKLQKNLYGLVTFPMMLVHQSETKGAKTIIAIWYFSRKRDNIIGKVTKYKSIICGYGVMQEKVINYW